MTTLVKPKTLFIGLSLLCVLAIWLSLALGPVSLPLVDTLRAALKTDGRTDRGPGVGAGRVDPGADSPAADPIGARGRRCAGIVGCGDAGVCSATRWPILALVGVSSGAALGAALAIVGGSFFGGLPDAFGPYLLSLCAFLGGLGVTALVYRLGRRNGQTNVATMLLAGIALTALAGFCGGALYLFG